MYSVVPTSLQQRTSLTCLTCHNALLNLENTSKPQVGRQRWEAFFLLQYKMESEVYEAELVFDGEGEQKSELRINALPFAL